SEQYTGAIPTSVDAGGVAGGSKTYGVIGIRLAEVPTKAAPAAAGPAPAKDGGFVADNDHIPGGGTHANTTDYSAMSGEAHSGLLRNIATGADTTVTLEVTAAGINYAGSQANPASGTDAYEIFDGFVDFGSATGASLEVASGDHYTYTFSNLDTGPVVTYNFHGTAIRGNSGYTDRWTLVTLVGADGFIPASSSGEGVVTRSFNSSLGLNQVAIWTGHNSAVGQGYVAGWTDIDPGADGVFEVVSQQYTGAIPTSVDPDGVANGSKGYAISGIRLEEVAPSGPQSWLKRMGDTDGNDAGDFARTAANTKGTQNPDMTVPFGTMIPTIMGIGFSDNQPQFEAVIESDVGEAMENVNASVWSRIEFTAAALPGYDRLVLRMRYDDGFVAYLNGTEVARRNADNPLSWNTAASVEHPNGQAVLFEDIDISAFLDQLVVGTNVLAIHGQNIAAGDADFLLQAELIASRGDPGTGLELFPGLNRVVVQAFDGEYGTGNKLDETYIDIWADTGPMNEYPRELGLRTNQIVRDSYLPGEPVLVRVEVLDGSGDVYRDLWDATATLSADNGITMDVGQITLFNGLGSALVRFTGSGPFNLTADVNGMQDSDDLTDLTGAAVTTVSGTLSSFQWSGIIHVTGDVLVPSGQTLTIDPGTLIRIDGVASGSGGADIDVEGEVQSLGTEDRPVTFTAYNSAEAWGEIRHNGSSSSLYQYTNIIIAGHSQGGGHTGSGPAFRPTGSTIVFEHTNITDNAGKVMQSGSGSDLTFRHCHLARSVMGPEIDNTALLFEDSWITENHGPDDNDGIYIHSQASGQECILRRGVIADTTDDGLDTLRANVLVEDYIFRNMVNDKGISVYGGEVTLNRIISVNNDIGISAKDESHAVVHIDHATIANNRLGIQAENKGGGMDNGLVEYFVTNSIIYGNTEYAVRSHYPLDPIDFDYCIVGESWVENGEYYEPPQAPVVTTGETWPGVSNDNTDALFVAPASGNFYLQSGSPAINAGNDGQNLGYYGPYVPPQMGDIVWRPQNGQFHIVDDFILPPDCTLTIMPGTTVFLDDGVSITIQGQLLAQGTAEAPIRLAPTTASGSWDGLLFSANMNDNVISHAIIGGVHRTNGMIDLVASNLTLEHSTLEDADLRRIRSSNSSLIVRGCVFTDFVFAGSPPNNVAEHIWGGGVPAGGHFIVEDNVFGLTPGHNDAIDFDAGSRPDPIPQILNNTFLGGGDDALDVEGDFHIEGNVFMHYRKDAAHAAVDGGESNVISAGSNHEYVVVGNVFYDSDHVSLIKEGSFMTFVNNTVANVSQGPYAALAGALFFDLPGQTPTPGEGAYVEGSVFADTPVAFNNLDSRGTITDLTVNRSMLPAAWHVYGTGNIDDDPRLSDPFGGDFSLANGSPAIGTGPVGEDMGADVPAGALLSPVFARETYLTGATFQVSGDAAPRRSAILAYRYRLNGGGWSADRTPGTPISLTGLGNGPQLLEVIARNSAGDWQEEADANSAAWTVNTALSRVLINEVLASNASAYDHEGTHPDIIELYNDSATGVDISGWSITDNVDVPTKFVLPPGTTIPGEGYLLLFADDATTPTSGIHLDFGIKAEGDDV
ncbi:MAG: lamin tail domain-containing protein, partial [Phycisphaerae bacterium]